MRKAIHILRRSEMGDSNFCRLIKLLPVSKITLNFMRNELSNIVGVQNVCLSRG